MLKANKKFTDHLQYSWWKYVLAVVAVVLLWVVLFDSLAQPKENEKVAIEFFGDGLLYDSINSEVKEKITEISDQPLKEIRFYASYTSAEAIATTIQARNVSSDILIIPELLLLPNENNVTMIEADDFFEELPTERLTEIWKERELGDFSELELFLVDGVPYGIYINLPEKSETENNFEKHYIGTERCIAFFAVGSSNLCGIYGTGSENDGAAFDVLAFLAEVE